MGAWPLGIGRRSVGKGEGETASRPPTPAKWEDQRFEHKEVRITARQEHKGQDEEQANTDGNQSRETSSGMQAETILQIGFAQRGLTAQEQDEETAKRAVKYKKLAHGMISIACRMQYDRG